MERPSLDRAARLIQRFARKFIEPLVNLVHHTYCAISTSTLMLLLVLLLRCFIACTCTTTPPCYCTATSAMYPIDMPHTLVKV